MRYHRFFIFLKENVKKYQKSEKSMGKVQNTVLSHTFLRKSAKSGIFSHFTKRPWEKRSVAGKNTDRYRTFGEAANEGKISLKIYFPLQAQGDLSKLTTHPLAQALPETR